MPEIWVGQGIYRLVGGLAFGVAVIAAAVYAYGRTTGRRRTITLLAICIGGFFLYRAILDPAINFVEQNNPAAHGNVGGLALPALLSWPVGGLFAAVAAWVVGKTRSGCARTIWRLPRSASARSSSRS